MATAVAIFNVSKVELISLLPSVTLLLILWQARRDLNPQPAVLETAALPVELLA